MSDRQGFCSGKTYRGVIIVTVRADGKERHVVIGAVKNDQVQLYECDTPGEAQALIDTGLLMESMKCTCLEFAGDNEGCSEHGWMVERVNRSFHKFMGVGA